MRTLEEYAEQLAAIGCAIVEGQIDKAVFKALAESPGGTLKNIHMETRVDCCQGAGYKVRTFPTVVTVDRCECLKVRVVLS
jgi:hypothetical protein